VKNNLVAFAAGVVFAVGLGLSGMTQPAKVLGFLDVAGNWDPSLAFVMMGAIGVHFVFARRALVARAPLFAPRFHFPEATKIDGRLLAGAAIFGAGWGLGGFCPGPALVALISLAPPVLVFVFAMCVAMLAWELLSSPAERQGDVEAARSS